MTILNFGSLNIDHVYRVAHLVRPGETIASTPKFNGPEIFIMKILLIFDDEKNHFPYKQYPWGGCARSLFNVRGPAGGTSGLPKFAAEIFWALAKAGGRPQGSRKGGGFAKKILEWAMDLWVNHTSPPLKVYTLGRFAVYRGDQLMDDSDWKRHKAKKMFKLLLMARQRQLRGEQVMETLWPDKT